MDAVLEATVRDSRGKNEARRTRAGGLVPAVVYGAWAAGEGDADGKNIATSISVEPKALRKILHSESGANTLISLKLAGMGDTRVLVKDYQLDPITHQILHADFYRIAMDKLLRVTVPVIARGDAPGVKQQGGILEYVHRQIDVECLPADIPEHIEINIGELMLHQGVRVRDVVVNPKLKLMTEGDTMLVHVIMPKAEEAAVTAADAAAAAPAAAVEPEVIKKGKKEEAEEKKE